MSIVAHFSLQQYELMVEAGAFDGRHHQRVEFIRGEIREMTPIGIGHAAVVDRLNRLSMELLPADRATVRIQGTLRAPSVESAPEPDVMWLRPKDYFQGHPEPEDVFLLVEVAESSLPTDVGEKAALYAEAGIQDYWVVDVDEQSVEVFREPGPSGYRSRKTHRGGGLLHPLAFPDVALDPAQFFRS